MIYALSFYALHEIRLCKTFLALNFSYIFDSRKLSCSNLSAKLLLSTHTAALPLYPRRNYFLFIRKKKLYNLNSKSFRIKLKTHSFKCEVTLKNSFRRLSFDFIKSKTCTDNVMSLLNVFLKG